nr:VRR-NUC domain-containing protein [Vibrio thalassae]
MKYAEISALDLSIAELADKGFITTCAPDRSYELADALLSKPEILNLFSGLKRTATKPDLIKQLRQEQPNDVPPLPFGVMRLLNDQILPLLCLLFFGNRHQDFAQFVLENLGIHKFENYEVSKATRLFNSRAEIDSSITLIQVINEYAELDTSNLELVKQLSSQIPNVIGPYATRQYQKFANVIARDLERLKEYTSALELFQTSELPPSRERQARILLNQKRHGEADVVVKSMLLHPISIDEQEVALRLEAKLNRALHGPRSHNSKVSFPERRLCIDLSGQRVELAVLNQLSNMGWHAFYLENHFLNTLFGMVFWDIIFAPIEGAFINPFQRQPLDLYYSTFIKKRERAIKQRLIEVEHVGIRPYFKILDAKQNTQNPFIAWDLVDRQWLDCAARVIDKKLIAELFAVMLSDLKAFRSGMPDLIAFRETEWLWCEVKGPGDKLQPNQKRWFKEMERLQINHEVCYVNQS